MNGYALVIAADGGSFSDYIAECLSNYGVVDAASIAESMQKSRNELARYEADLATVQSLSEQDCAQRAQEAYADEKSSSEERVATQEAQLAKLRPALQQAENLVLPSEDEWFSTFRAFAIKNLVDAVASAEYALGFEKKRLADLQPESAEAWRTAEVQRLNRRIENAKSDVARRQGNIAEWTRRLSTVQAATAAA